MPCVADLPRASLQTISCGIAALMLSRYLAPMTLVSSSGPAAPRPAPNKQQPSHGVCTATMSPRSGTIPGEGAWTGGRAWPWLAALPLLSPPAEMGGFRPEHQQQPGLPVLPAGAGRLHRADAGQPGPGTAGPLHRHRCHPCPSLPRVPLRSHPCLRESQWDVVCGLWMPALGMGRMCGDLMLRVPAELHAVPLGHLPPARLNGDRLQHPLPPAHP